MTDINSFHGEKIGVKIQHMTEEHPSQSRARRQFITYAKARAIDDVARLATMFVQYLNSNVGGGGGDDEG